MLQPTLVEPPADTPVSVDEAKEHCRITHGEDDAFLERLIGAAVGHLDGRAGVLGRCIMEQTWSFPFARWPANRYLRIGLPDVSAVSVAYSDADGVEQTLGADNYRVGNDAAGGFLWMRNAFVAPALDDDRPDPIRVLVTAAMPEDGPALEAVRHAILLMVGHWYENRESVVVGQVDVRELPGGFDTLIEPLRRVA